MRSGELISSLSGASSYDSSSDEAPNFNDQFAPGYEGFTSATLLEPGKFKVEFNRALQFSVTHEEEVSLTTLQAANLFVDGFEEGNLSPWTVDSSNTFTFRVTSPDPLVRFSLKGELEPLDPEILISRTQNFTSSHGPGNLVVGFNSRSRLHDPLHQRPVLASYQLAGIGRDCLSRNSGDAEPGF